MIHAYNECYLNCVMHNLGELFSIAILQNKKNPNEFGRKFSESVVATGIERNNPRYLAGMSSIELLNEVEKMESIEVLSENTDVYWAGMILAFTNWYYGKNFKFVLENISFKDIIAMYPDYRSLDPEEAAKKIHEYFPEDTNLKRIRQMRALTQKQLADYSGVKIRAIQGYEQKDNDINKAQGETLYALARTLDCRIEDLLE